MEIEIALPREVEADERQRLMAAEAERARELAADGSIARLWRIPGRTANVGLWVAPDATALHAALSSLPLFAWMDIRVQALARHPSDPLGATDD